MSVMNNKLFLSDKFHNYYLSLTAKIITVDWFAINKSSFCVF